MRKIQIAISSDLCIRLTWNLTGSCGQQQRLSRWSRMVVKQFQDGGRPPFWKSIYHHISAKKHPIFMKFCTQQQILNWMYITWSKMKKLHWTDSEFDRTYFLFYEAFRFRCGLLQDTWVAKICESGLPGTVDCISESWCSMDILSRRCSVIVLLLHPGTGDSSSAWTGWSSCMYIYIYNCLARLLLCALIWNFFMKLMLLPIIITSYRVPCIDYCT